ncbi:uncharacterized protein LODBEIA_P57890 [Lodderomyces beijingensis]|uniref:Uncharacterized protein n=1 Tax=Lodderomyces beijingensis TaxID=1775926 RepID=A0ABP0ZX22_9ASCO
MLLQIDSSYIKILLLAVSFVGWAHAANLGGLDGSNNNAEGRNSQSGSGSGTAGATPATPAAPTTAGQPNTHTQVTQVLSGTQTLLWIPTSEAATVTPRTTTVQTQQQQQSQPTTLTQAGTTGGTPAVTFNQWGFTGSQSVWQNPTTTGSASGSANSASTRANSSGRGSGSNSASASASASIGAASSAAANRPSGLVGESNQGLLYTWLFCLGSALLIGGI